MQFSSDSVDFRLNLTQLTLYYLFQFWHFLFKIGFQSDTKFRHLPFEFSCIKLYKMDLYLILKKRKNLYQMKT